MKNIDKELFLRLLVRNKDKSQKEIEDIFRDNFGDEYIQTKTVLAIDVYKYSKFGFYQQMIIPIMFQPILGKNQVLKT